MFQLLIKKGKNIDVFGSVFKLSPSGGKLFSAYLYLNCHETRYHHRIKHKSAENDTMKECNLYDCFLGSTSSDT